DTDLRWPWRRTVLLRVVPWRLRDHDRIRLYRNSCGDSPRLYRWRPGQGAGHLFPLPATHRLRGATAREPGPAERTATKARRHSPGLAPASGCWPRRGGHEGVG